MIVYVDTSAALKLVIAEAESAVLAQYLEESSLVTTNTLIASLLLHTELRCAANRRPEEVDREAIGVVLSLIALADVEREDFTTAPLLSGRLRSADAIHLAAALRLEADAIVVYDKELSAAAENAGLTVIRPA